MMAVRFKGRWQRRGPSQISLDRNGMVFPPAELGWSPALLAEVQEKSARLHLTAVMVIHHRTVVAQWGDTTKRDRRPIRQDRRHALAGARSVDTEENSR